MGRILAIDFGTKRTGLAVSDPLQIIATALDTVSTDQLLGYLKNYMQRETVDILVMGLPKQLDNSDSATAGEVRRMADQLRATFPSTPLHLVDERFTSKIAFQSMIMGGAKKKDRRDKGAVDRVSATLILQSFMEGHTKG